MHVRCMWTIGPLQPAIHVVQNCHAGEQVALGQDKQKIHNFILLTNLRNLITLGNIPNTPFN